MHKSEPLGESKIKININGEEMDRVIGSKTKTIHTSCYWSTTHDWHTNDSKKQLADPFFTEELIIIQGIAVGIL